MQAIILAGGGGTRLRPLTDTTPKPLLPVAGHPALEHLILALAEAGIEEVLITTNYLAGRIGGWLDSRVWPCRVRCIEEDKPLGTAGCVKNCLSQLGEEFLVVQGDAVSEIDYRAFIASHHERGAQASIAAMRVSDTRDFGIVEADDAGRIQRFQEKPAPEDAFSDLANAGFYLLHKSVFDDVPEGEPHDFSRQLFPRLLAENARFFVWQMSGYWADIGRVRSYVQANRYLLRGAQVEAGVVIAPSAILHPPYLIQAGARIGANCIVGPGAVVGRNCTLGDGTRVGGSVLHDDVWVGAGAGLRECVAAQGARLESGVQMEPMAVAGAGCHVGAGALLKSQSIVPTRAIVPDGAVVEGEWQADAAAPAPVSHKPARGARKGRSRSRFPQPGEALIVSAL